MMPSLSCENDIQQLRIAFGTAKMGKVTYPVLRVALSHDLGREHILPHVLRHEVRRRRRLNIQVLMDRPRLHMRPPVRRGADHLSGRPYGVSALLLRFAMSASTHRAVEVLRELLDFLQSANARIISTRTARGLCP